MTRSEATQLLQCSLAGLAKKLGITTAAVAQWPEEKIPELREYQVRELARTLNIAEPAVLSGTLKQQCIERNI